jgi:hypothetical protein
MQLVDRWLRRSGDHYPPVLHYSALAIALAGPVVIAVGIGVLTASAFMVPLVLVVEFVCLLLVARSIGHRFRRQQVALGRGDDWDAWDWDAIAGEERPTFTLLYAMVLVATFCCIPLVAAALVVALIVTVTG